MTHRTISWNAPYTFSGKEKDVETGYGYFGARYYDSGLSIWLSVDPMSDSLPSYSSYIYCLDNPVNFLDHDGQIPWPTLIEGYIYGSRSTDAGNGFGYRIDPITGVEKNHKGIDLGFHVPKLKGTEHVRSAASGKVIFAGQKKGYGYCIEIDHGNGYVTRYAHLKSNSFIVEVGQTVKNGQNIAIVGNTGRSRGIHLHFEIEYNGQKIDPTSIYDLEVKLHPTQPTSAPKNTNSTPKATPKPVKSPSLRDLVYDKYVKFINALENFTTSY